MKVINTNISSAGTSLCNGPLVLSAPSGFLAYNWNGPSTNNLLTVIVREIIMLVLQLIMV